MIEMKELDYIYKDNPNDLVYQAYKIASSYWRTKKVYERWFLSRIENILDEKRYNISTRADVFNAWLENVMYFIITKKALDNWNEERGTLSTYICSIISLNEYIFAYQILYNFTQEEALTYSRKLKEGKAKDDLNTRNHKSILYCHSSLDEPVTKDSSAKDKEILLGEIIEDNNTTSVQKEIEIQETLKQIFDTIDKTKKFKDCAKNIIRCYIKNNCSYTTTARELGCSRQRVEQVIKRFRELLKHKGISYEN